MNRFVYTRPRKTTTPAKKRFAVGANVLVKTPGVWGVVTQLDDEPTVFWEYWHTVRTDRGECREPGSNLELVPRPISDTEPDWSRKVAQNIHIHGDNSRLNVNSTDNSTNIVSESKEEQLFVQMQEAARSVTDDTEREDVVSLLAELQKAHGSGGFLQAYQNFMASAANHMTLFAPFLPMLAQMLSNK